MIEEPCTVSKRVSWWERELPSEQEMSEGIENLKKYGNKVDYRYKNMD